MGRPATIAPQKIMEVLARAAQPLTPEEIATSSGSPGKGKNVYNVLAGLVKSGSVLHDVQAGRYALNRSGGLEKKILAALLKQGMDRRRLERALAPVKADVFSGELDSLVALGFVSEIKITLAAGPPEFLYQITPAGATSIDACFVCGKELDGPLIVANIPVSWEAFAEGNQAAAHPECWNAWEADPHAPTKEDSFCSHCGLPLVPLHYQLRYVRPDLIRGSLTEWETSRLQTLRVQLAWAVDEVVRRKLEVPIFLSPRDFEKVLSSAELGTITHAVERQNVSSEVLVARARLCQILDGDLTVFAEEFVSLLYAGTKELTEAKLKRRAAKISTSAAQVEERTKAAWFEAYRQLMGPQGIALNQLEPYWAKSPPPEHLGDAALLQVPALRAQQGFAVRRNRRWLHPLCARETAGAAMPTAISVPFGGGRK